MPQAFLIAGSTDRFLQEVRDVRTFLKRRAGVYIKKEFGTAYADEGMAGARLSLAIAQKTKDPLLVLFCGHGDPSGWSFDDDRTLSYADIATFLTAGRRPVLVVNDCCHAMALAEHLEKKGASPERVGLIAACEADATTLKYHLVWQVLHCWGQRKAHPSGSKTRWGAELDHHFFAKPTEPP